MISPLRDFESVMAAVLEGAADERQLACLQEMMRADPALVGEYHDQFRMHALLEWRTGGVVAETAAAIAVPARRKPGGFTWLAAAAGVALAATLWWKRDPSVPVGPPAVAATVNLEVLEAARSGAATSLDLATGAILSLSELKMPPGFFRFRLESGAIVAVTGPAELKFLNPMHLQVVRGKVTADVGDGAKGFIVETAQTMVVDLGTRFGVDVAESGHTDVVVFQGEVELHDTKQKGPKVNRLIEGEAVRVNFDQQVSRISSITSGPEGDDEWSASDIPHAGAVVTSVYDNLHNPKSNFYYRILRGGMREDATAFIAKRHQWNGLDDGGMPSWLQGADLIQTFGGGARNENLELTLDVAVPSEIYLFVDSRVVAPAWLKQEFSDTGMNIGLENAPLPESGIPIKNGAGNGNLAPFRIWKKQVPQPRSLKLGAPPAAPIDRPHWMYGIAARRL